LAIGPGGSSNGDTEPSRSPGVRLSLRWRSFAIQHSMQEPAEKIHARLQHAMVSETGLW